MATINDLPQEVLEHILHFISPYGDIKACKLVCHRWYASCLEVVKKRKSNFAFSLKSGCIEWFNPTVPKHLIPITQRYSHSSCIHDCAMYVFGGCTTTNTTFNDLWKFNLRTYEWTRLLTMGTYPSPKAYASMVNWKKKLVLFGGWNHPSLYPLHQQCVLFNELHIYEINVNQWTQIYYTDSPPPTAGHTATVHGDNVIFIGGLQKQEGLSTSTNDVYCLDLINQIWYKPNVSTEKPLPRYGHSQIKLDENHLLIVAGCGGSNKLYSDVWLLTVPDVPQRKHSEWIWECLTVEGLENLPFQMWYNPACKIADHVVVMSTWQSSNNSSKESGKMQQLFVPGLVRRQASAAWVPGIDRPPIEANPMDQPAIAEYNVNGQRGVFKGASAADDEEAGTSVKGRQRPSVRPNASSDRERRLEALSKMEERLRTLSKLKETSHQKSKLLHRSNKNILVPHILDITRAISHKIVTWLPVELNEDGFPPYIGTPPPPCVLYTLLCGRGHLIMFGGIPNDPQGGGGGGASSTDSLLNSVSFISAPSSTYQVL